MEQGPAGSVSQLSSNQIAANPAARSAVQTVHDQVANTGNVLVDGHGGNFAFAPNGFGGLKAIVIDPDFVMTPQELTASINARTIPGEVLGSALARTPGFALWGSLKAGQPVSASSLSNALLNARFPLPPTN